MILTSVTAYQVDLPYPGVYKLSGGREYQSFKTTVVRLETDSGLVGWRESCPFGGTYIEAHPGGVLAALHELCPAILGLDPRTPTQIYAAMDQVLVSHAAAKAAIYLAVWDLAGKAAGIPVCDLLGGRIEGPVALISSIGTDTPDTMRASGQRHRDLGFTHHSIKVGASESEGGPSLDAARLSTALADRQPGEWFLVDANGGLSLEHARRLFELLPKGLDFVLEAPCATWAETIALRHHCPYPIMLDELVQTDGDAALAIQQQACDGLNLKLGKQGGLTRALAQRTMAQAAGLTVSIQVTWGAEISLAAILHMAQSTPRSMLRGALDTRPLVETSIADLDIAEKGTGLEAPVTPRLGIHPKLDIIGNPVAGWELR